MDVRSILKVAFFTPGVNGRWGLPLVFSGDVGTGKSSATEAECKHFGLEPITIIASLREPQDFYGLPMMDTVKNEVKRFPDAWVLDAIEAGQAVVFIDEISTCTPATQKALLRVILDGVVGDYTLPKQVRFVAAMNPTDDAADGWDLTQPMANRFGHLPWPKPDAHEWAAAFMLDFKTNDGVINATKLEEQVMSVWPSVYSTAKAQVTAFIRKRGDLLHQKPAAHDPKASKAFPTARTWEMATRALAGCTVHKMGADVVETLMGAFVGVGPASEFMAWLAAADLPEPMDILDGKIEFRFDKYRLDRTHATLMGCAGILCNVNLAKSQERMTRLVDILIPLTDSAADVVLGCVQMLKNGNLALIMDAKVGATTKLLPNLYSTVAQVKAA